MIRSQECLLEIVWYVRWVIGECPVAVLERWCQDIVSERQRCAFNDFQVYSLCSPKTQIKGSLSQLINALK